MQLIRKNCVFIRVLVCVLVITSLCVSIPLKSKAAQERNDKAPAAKSKDIESQEISSEGASALQQARSIMAPIASVTSNGEYEHSSFWNEHGALLRTAWEEYYHQQRSYPIKDSDDEDGNSVTNDGQQCEAGGIHDDNELSLDNLVNPSLIQSILECHEHPSLLKEQIVKTNFETIEDGEIYQTSLLTPKGIQMLRHEMNVASKAKIPYRRPNGMNRYGMIIDPTVDGAVSYPILNSFIEELVETIGRPIGRMFFPSTVGKEDDCDYYAFTIRYADDEDVELKEHRDASLITLNINLNLPEEEYNGSDLYFVMKDGTKKEVKFEPGRMMIHKGDLRHAAIPIESGTRNNLIIWLFGKHGDVRIMPYEKKDQMRTEERWGRKGDTTSSSTSYVFDEALLDL